MTFSYYYADPDGNRVELQVDNFGDWAKSTEWMRTSEEFKANPIGQFVDPEKVAEDHAEGVNFEEIHAKAMAGGYAPEQAPVEIRRRPDEALQVRDGRGDSLWRGRRRTSSSTRLAGTATRSRRCGCSRPCARGSSWRIGLNYADHIAESGMEAPEFPVFFNKQSTCVVGPGDDVHLPRVSSLLDYEGELAIVIGERCRHVPEEGAPEVIAGYTIANDLSVRDWQLRTPTMTMGKSFDTTARSAPGS